MADKILGTLLRALERVYKFPSAQKGSPDSFELDLPIQPIHDLSKMAILGSGIAPINDGYWIQTARHAHVAVGQLTSTPSPFDNSLPVANGFPATRSQRDLAWWMIDSWSYNDDFGDFSDARDAINHGSATVGPYAVGAQLRRRILHYWSTRAGSDNLQDSDLYVVDTGFPLRVLENQISTISAFWYLLSNSQNVGTVNIDFNMLFWMGPPGVCPPKAW